MHSSRCLQHNYRMGHSCLCPFIICQLPLQQWEACLSPSTTHLLTPPVPPHTHNAISFLQWKVCPPGDAAYVHFLSCLASGISFISKGAWVSALSLPLPSSVQCFYTFVWWLDSCFTFRCPSSYPLTSLVICLHWAYIRFPCLCCKSLRTLINACCHVTAMMLFHIRVLLP